jgi:hypothetical protein
MSDKLPDVYFGSVDYVPPDLVDDTPDDDEELAETPWDVVALLGFDPLEEDDLRESHLREGH